MQCLSLDVKQPPINQPLKLSFFHAVKRYFQQYFSNSVAVLKQLISLIILTIIFASSNFVLSSFFSFFFNIWRSALLHTCFTHFSIHSDFRVIEHVQIVVVHDDRVVYYIISFDICNLFYCFMGGYPFCSDCTPSVLFCQIEFCSMYPALWPSSTVPSNLYFIFHIYLFSLNRCGPFLCCSLELVLCFIWLWPFDTVSLELL